MRILARQLIPKGQEVWGWALYDFANSAYSTALVGVIFQFYFTRFVVGPEGVDLLGRQISGPSLWGYSVSFSMVLVAVTAPFLGAVADYYSSKKRFLFYSCYGGVACTAMLFMVKPGDVWLAVTFYVLSNLGLELSMGFYNGFLPELTSPKNVGRVSGFGWALGYVGGVACLLLCLAILERPNWFGLVTTDYLPVRTTLLFVAVWWGLFSIPIFCWLKEKTRRDETCERISYLKAGFRRLELTFRKVNQLGELVKFLIAFLIYNDGIQTVIVMATVFGATELGMPQGELIRCFIAIHIAAFVGALGFGVMADRWTIKSSIHSGLFVWTTAVFYVLFIHEIWEFWVLAIAVGFVLGGVQASSRALFARFTPATSSAEFFGFFATSGKFASILGPALFAFITDLTGMVRAGVASVVVFFIVGWVLFYYVDEEKGIIEARSIG